MGTVTGAADLQLQQDGACPQEERGDDGTDVVLQSSRRRPASQPRKQNSQKQHKHQKQCLGRKQTHQSSWSRRRTVRVWGACERDGQSHTLAHGGIGGRIDADNAAEGKDERLSFDIELSLDLTSFGMAPVDNNATRPSRLALDASNDLGARRRAVSRSNVLWSAQRSEEADMQDATASTVTPIVAHASVDASVYKMGDGEVEAEAKADAEAEAEAVRNRMLSIHESMADTSVGGQLKLPQSPLHSPKSPKSQKSPELAFWSSSAPMTADESAAATVKWFDEINADRSVGNASIDVSEGFDVRDEAGKSGAPGGFSDATMSFGKADAHVDGTEADDTNAPTSTLLATEAWEAKRDVVSRSRQPLLVSHSTGHALFFEVPPVLRWLETLCDAHGRDVGWEMGAHASVNSGELLALDTQAAGDAEADWLPSDQPQRVLSLANARQCFLYLQVRTLAVFFWSAHTMHSFAHIGVLVLPHCCG